jgi:hypothetical protein
MSLSRLEYQNMPYRVYSAHDEYFVAIAKQDYHTFLMLGVVDKGVPRLFTRVGKANIDVNTPNPSNTLKKFLFDSDYKILGKMDDEGINRGPSYEEAISYQAYSLNFNQLKEFLALIAAIDKKQLENTQIAEYVKKSRRRHNLQTDEEILAEQAICGYVPVDETNEQAVRFTFKKLTDCNFSTEKAIDNVVEGAQYLRGDNTCRKTAIDMVEAMLGFTTDVPRSFLSEPKFATRLKAGVPDKDNFYILPPPAYITPDERGDTLSKLYKRLEEIPLSKPSCKKTRAKFDAVKKMYNDIAGMNNWSLEDLLLRIEKHENSDSKALYEKRGIFSRFFGSSTTEDVVEDIKSNLRKRI